MSSGDRWKLPDGREALEIGRDGEQITVCVLKPGWPFPSPPMKIRWKVCRKMPSRYLHGQIPVEEFGEAPF
jgi:hypothetical protein